MPPTNTGDASPGLRHHLDPSADPLLELSHVGDDADRATALAQVRQDLESLIQSFGIERAKAFIDEQRLEAHTAGVVLDDVRQPQGKRQRRHETLAAG